MCFEGCALLSDFFNIFNFAFGVTGPTFVMVALGVFLKRLDVIDTLFMDKASKLVFLVGLPVLLFMSVVKTDIREVINPTLILVSLAGTLLVFVLLSLVAPWVVTDRRDAGVFVQGSFRGNLAIVGLALCINAYGSAGLTVASVLMSVLTLLYNVLSVYTLNASLSNSASTNFKHVALSLLKNPLIIAILLGFCFSLLHIPIHSTLMKSGEYLSQMTLPLALLCIGGSLSFNEMRSSSYIAFWATAAKLIITPAIIVYLVYLAGIRGIELGVVFIMASTPSAAVSYIMVKAMDGNAKLAANIIVLSTLLSLFSVSFGLAFLKGMQLI